MKIHIEYDSCWQNSFLDDKASSTKSNVRKFNKSKTKGNLQQISKNTILGVLYRLIGDQRTLDQIKKSGNSYFSDIEGSINFQPYESNSYEELVMLINKSNDRTSDGKYIGIPRDDTALFFSENSPQLWAVLYLEVEEVINFIHNPLVIDTKNSAMPRDILNRIADIEELAPLETMDKLVGKEEFKLGKQRERLLSLQSDHQTKQVVIDKLRLAIEKTEDSISEIKKDGEVKRVSQKVNDTLVSLEKHFPDVPSEDYIKKGGEVLLIRLYAAALYIQAELMEASGIDMSEIYILQTKGINKGCKTIQGFSKKGFNGVRDFINLLSTGGTKKTVKTPFLLTKAGGRLEINIDIDRGRAKKIRSMIENAGVSSFYLGKKGLAYISQEIDTRELIR